MKKIMIITLAFVMLFSNTVFAFSDLDGHWSKNFVTYLADNGIIDGYSDQSFRPDDKINVEEFLKLTLYNIGEKTPTSSGYWADALIKRALALDIVWNGEFSEYNRPITRGEIARIIVRALKLTIPDGMDTKALIAQIPDYYDILNTYKEYVLITYANHLVTGYNNGSFDCNKNATRAEATVIITRMMKLKPVVVPDSPKTGSNQYFVATDGNDTNDGTIERPFRTIEKARDVIRGITERPKGGITVNIRGGEYEIASTVAFSQNDGGTSESPVTYQGYQNEKVQLIGGKSLNYSNFKKINQNMSAKLLTSDAKSKVLEIDLKSEGIEDYGRIVRRGFLINDSEPTQMELFIGGERMQLGRWPNSGYTGIGETVRSGKRTKSEMSLGAVYKYTDTQPSKWKTNVENIFVAGVLGPNYAFDYYPLGKIDTAANEITLREGAIQSYYSKPFVYYENIFEEIDAPGEYYVDRENGILYLYPPKEFSKDTDIRVSQLKDTMIAIDSCNHLNFRNLELGTTRGQVIRSTNPTDSLLVENCTIRNTGNAGNAINNTKNTKIRNNHIYDIGYTGISLAGGDYDKLISGNNIIENNHIHKIAQIERSYQTGVTLGYRSVGTILRNNEIHDTPHTAIIIYGPEHIVEYNNIYDVVKEFHDMDAIYMNVYVYPWERGVVIRNNYIHDLGQRTFVERQMNVAGIRTDNNGNGLTVTQNVFYNIGYKDSNQIRAVCAERTRTIITNNLFIDTAEGYDGPSSYNPDAKFDTENNQALKTAYQDFLKYAPVYGAKYPEIVNFWKEHFLAAKKTNVYSNNAVVSISIPISTLNAGYDPSGYRAAPELVLAEKNYQTNKDPGFLDYKNKNFTLKPDSEIFTKIPDFKPIEFEKIGIPKNETVGSNE